MKTGLVEMRGPMTEEEKADWGKLREHKVILDELIPELEEAAAKDPDDRSLRRALAKTRRVQAMITDLIAD